MNLPLSLPTLPPDTKKVDIYIFLRFDEFLEEEKLLPKEPVLGNEHKTPEFCSSPIVEEVIESTYVGEQISELSHVLWNQEMTTRYLSSMKWFGCDSMALIVDLALSFGM